MTFSLFHGDCIEVMRRWPDNTFDAVLTDPPYELTSAKRTVPPPHVDNPFGRHRVGVNGDSKPIGGFMGKQWDGSGIAFSVDLWREVLRVTKPGAFGLMFGGTRTAHRMACAIEDAGFEVVDWVSWINGTGFPKSKRVEGLDGMGTRLKPSHEPIYLVCKPREGTYENNVQQHGVGMLNIDACRLGREPIDPDGGRGSNRDPVESVEFHHGPGPRGGSLLGRWPANVILDEDAAAELDAQTMHLKRGGAIGAHTAAAAAAAPTDGRQVYSAHNAPRGEWVPHGDSGGASRFFYCAKPTRKERDLGCEHLPMKSAGEVTDREDGSAGLNSPRAGAGRTSGARNIHPTCKPITLMQYLCKLIVPPGGLVLDPFCGSGTTGVAALREGRRFVGIDMHFEYVAIANARITTALQGEEG